MSDAVVAAFGVRIHPRAVTGLEKQLLVLGARFDRLMLRILLRVDTEGDRIDPALCNHLRQAHEFYRNPLFLTDPSAFFVTPSAPSAVRERELRTLREGTCLDVAFESGFVPMYPEARPDYARFVENRTAHTHWWRHAGGAHPTVLCLHGYGSGYPWVDALAFEARQLYRAGFDVLLYTLPFQGRRRPRSAGNSGEPFFGPNLVRTNEAFAQTIFETRMLMRYVQSRGGGPVGAFGMSLGAYVTALLAAVEPQLAFAIAMIPLVSLPDLAWGEPLHRKRRQEVEAHGITLTLFRELSQVHAPLLRPALVPRGRRFVIGALGDRICPPTHAAALWEHWERPPMHWYPGGHLAQFRRGRALDHARRFLHELALAG